MNSVPARKETHMIVADALLGAAFWTAFARYGQERHGLCYMALCWHRSHARQYEIQGELFHRVAYGSGPLEAYGKNPVEIEALEAFAVQFEAETGELISDIIQADRHLGRGYYYGGQRHPMSPLGDKADYWATVQLIRSYCALFEDLFAKYGVKAVLLGGVASLATKLLCVVAHRRGVAVRVLIPARIANRYAWALDEYSAIPGVANLRAFPPASPEHVKEWDSGTGALSRHEAAARFEALFAARFSLRGLCGGLTRELRQALREVLRSLLRGRQAKIGDYHLRARLGFNLNVFTDYRRLARVADPTWTAAKARPYVFLPLHVEPEATLMVFSPEFNNQISMIDLIAKSLPAGIILVVKEHTAAVGRRPRDFYRWLSTLPNVAIAPLNADGPTLARGSRATVTITGTAGFEAAVAGVPVVTFGQHNFYNVLDHVHLVRDIDALRPLLRALTTREQDTARQRSDGERLLAAVIAASVDLEDKRIFNRQAPAPEAVEKLFENFMVSLTAGVRVTRSQMQ